MGLVAGPNTVEKNGQRDARVYCEGEARKSCAFMYSTHVAIPQLNPCWFFGCLLELVFDRSRGDTVHRQWRQRLNSAHLTGAWVHIADIRKAYESGSAGTLRVHGPQYRLGLRGIQRGHSLRNALEYQKAEYEAQLSGEQADYTKIPSLPP